MVADHLQVDNILSQILIGMDQILTQKDPPNLEAKAAKKLWGFKMSFRLSKYQLEN